MDQANKKVRETFKSTHVPQWRVAETLGIGDRTLSRMLRTELPEETQELIITCIRSIANREKSGLSLEKLAEEKQEKVEPSPDKDEPEMTPWGIVQVRDDIFRCGDLQFTTCLVDRDEALAIAFGKIRLCIHVPLQPLRQLLCQKEE